MMTEPPFFWLFGPGNGLLLTLGLTVARARRTLNGVGELLRKLRSFFATAISVNPLCKLMICNVKNRGCCSN